VFCGLALLIAGIFLWFETRSIHLPTPAGQDHPDYHHAALNCFIGVGIYAALLAVSIVCICVGRYKAKKEEANRPLNNRPLTLPISGSVQQVDSAE
jgi:heme/copper-type cytochrome/quinol oxidase subunit 2